MGSSEYITSATTTDLQPSPRPGTWMNSPNNASEPARYVGTDLADIPLVQSVLNGERTPIPGSDDLGDKFSGLIATGAVPRRPPIEGADGERAAADFEFGAGVARLVEHGGDRPPQPVAPVDDTPATEPSRP